MRIPDHSYRRSQMLAHPGRPRPIGYLNVREKSAGKEIAKLVLDPERALLVREAFRLYAIGAVISVRGHPPLCSIPPTSLPRHAASSPHDGGRPNELPHEPPFLLTAPGLSIRAPWHLWVGRDGRV